MMGRTTPPRLDPAVTMPKARARWTRNQVPRAAIAIGDCVRVGGYERGNGMGWGMLTGIEEKRAAYGTADALGEENLIVFLGD